MHGVHAQKVTSNFEYRKILFDKNLPLYIRYCSQLAPNISLVPSLNPMLESPLSNNPVCHAGIDLGNKQRMYNTYNVHSLIQDDP